MCLSARPFFVPAGNQNTTPWYSRYQSVVQQIPKHGTTSTKARYFKCQSMVPVSVRLPFGGSMGLLLGFFLRDAERGVQFEYGCNGESGNPLVVVPH